MINGDSRSPAGTPILALICDGASSPYRLHNLGKQVITTDGVQQQPPQSQTRAATSTLR
jgi:hypothetical protein